MIILTPQEEQEVIQRRTDVVALRRARFRAIRNCLRQLGKREQKLWKAQYRCGYWLFLKPNPFR